MQIFVQGNPSVGADIGQITPKLFNVSLLKDILDTVTPIAEMTLPAKRSGYSYAIFVLFQILIQISRLSPKHVAEIMNQACIEANISFHSYTKPKFSNQKHRRFFPDQPGLSRCLSSISDMNLTESFWNAVLFSHLVFLQKKQELQTEKHTKH